MKGQSRDSNTVKKCYQKSEKNCSVLCVLPVCSAFGHCWHFSFWTLRETRYPFQVGIVNVGGHVSLCVGPAHYSLPPDLKQWITVNASGQDRRICVAKCRFSTFLSWCVCTLCSLGGVVYQRPLVDATGHNPVMSSHCREVDPGAESRAKVTAGWRTAGAAPHRNVI